MRELIVDNFAGGGGASTGIELALGRPVDIAINHDPMAIAMHRANHPNTEHLCESVWDVDPRKVTRGRPVALCWLSPDCTHFSKAKGSKPLSKNIRGLAWVAVRWAATVRPRVIMLENVEEFQTWGPLTPDGYPDPRQKSKTFNAFVNALKRHGYHVDFQELRACDYGAPTSRKRFFMVARCDGQPIRWPKPTHGDPNNPEVKSGRLKPWRTAVEILDWTKPCPSIFDTAEEIKAKYGLKAVRPLAKKTMERIAKGVQKFIIENQEPFILSKEGSIMAPFLAQYHSYSGDGARGQTIDRPILTIGTNPRYALVTSHLVKLKGTNYGQPVTEPLQTVTAGGNHFGEVRAFLTHYYGTSIGSKINEPLPTVVSKDRFGLVVVAGLNYQIVDIGMRMLEPRELFNAQGFPTDYVIDRDDKGNRYPKAEQVARCGNAVPPPFAEALVRANLHEICKKTKEDTEEEYAV
ncbi:MAG: hypothetical protein HPY66_3151 [Firmicutes bacterium]|nr:hypothetical protein [Bacillota bacterium]